MAEDSEQDIRQGKVLSTKEVIAKIRRVDVYMFIEWTEHAFYKRSEIKSIHYSQIETGEYKEKKRYLKKAVYSLFGITEIDTIIKPNSV